MTDYGERVLELVRSTPEFQKLSPRGKEEAEKIARKLTENAESPFDMIGNLLAMSKKIKRLKRKDELGDWST